MTWANNRLSLSSIQELARSGSEKVRNLLKTFKENHIEVDRPSWDQYFINIAKVASERSSDSQTKVGAVVVNDNNQILGVGYNGPVAGINDIFIPNTRPLKYPFYLHGEINAISNCTQMPRGAKVYLNMRPCTTCLQFMAQIGIKEVIYVDNKPVMCQDEEQENLLTILVALLENKIKMRVYTEPNT